MRIAAALLVLCLPALPLPAKADMTLHPEVRAAVARADNERLLELAAELGGPREPSPVMPAEAAKATAPVDARPGEIQAALMQLSILSGGNGHLALQLAQASRTDVIDLISGTAGLADLEGIDGVREVRPGAWRLSRPLVIWPGAALVLSRGDVLELDTQGGAFVLSFGTVSLTEATLRGDAGVNARVPTFRPFLLITGQGSLRAERSTFANLGFRGPAAFRGVSVLTSSLMRPLASSAVIDSRLVQVFSLSAEGADGMVISGTRLEAAGAAAIAVKSGVGVVLSGNRIGGTKDGAGIRLSGVLKKVALLGNLVASGGRNGVQIDGTTQGLVLRGNVLTDNAETGLAIRNASCVAVQGNIIAGNGASGVTLSRSGQVRIAGNAILANGSAGLDVEAQAGPMLLSDNLVADNREGLRGAGLGETHLAGNDLADQLPRQFAGDFAPFLAAYLGAEAKLVIPAVRPTEVSSASCPTE
jgi:hypothetical protein